MTPNRWQQIEEIFQSAIDLAPDEREKFVESRSGGDLELKKEVEKLLSDFDSAADFIESPVWTDSRFLNSVARNEIKDSLDRKIKPQKRGASASMLGKRIGVYELTEEIGRGGMGAVYLAERADGEFRQQVAIKLIKRGMDTDFVLSRFRNERQILANLNHSNIVLLLDGGTTDDGLPYFVMDFVEGEPLHKYCDRKKLNLTERLEIFRQVCDAVDYAHQKMVVHRDLKPSNILVNKYGIPKLLDFGIAKLLDPEQATDTLIPTETHMRLMTPEYASPEQVSGAAITPASDIYSLGVLLYELVTGTRPYKFPTRSPYEVARIICEEEPIKPSEAAKDQLPGNEQKSKGKGQLNSELDKIILKALRKNPAERYETEREMADDLERFLGNQPVKAQFYAPAQKKKQEIKESELSIAILPFKLFGTSETEHTGGDEYLGVGLADSLVMRLSTVKRLLVRPTSSTLRFGESAEPFQTGRELGVDFILTGNIRRVGDRIRVMVQLLKVADETTSWAENFNEKFTDVLEVEDSISEKVAVSLLPYLTGEERKQLEKRGTNSPEAYEAFLRGRFNWNLQSEEGFARAIGYYRRAVELDPEYAQAYAAIAEYYIFLGIHCVIPFGEGAQAAKQAAEKAIRLDPNIAEGYAALGFAAISFDLDWKKAKEYFDRALEVNPNSTSTRFWRTALLMQQGHSDEAIQELKRLEEIDPDSLIGIHMLAWVLYHSRRFDESIAAYRRTFKIEPNYAWGLQTYSWVLRRIGEYEEAIAKAERAVQLSNGNPFYLAALAAAYAEGGQKPKAEELLDKLAEISKTRFVSEYMLALVYCAMGDKDKAFENLEKSVAQHDGWVNWLGVEPQFDILQDDPRFDELLRRTRNPFAKPEEKTTGQPTTNSEKSIAVLPLKLIGAPVGSTEDEYLGVGLSDALVTRLSNVRRLIVRPTSSVLAFRDAEKNPFQAGRELGVNYILDGNIRRSGERIRVTVQLLNVEDNSSRWAESFNELFTDVLELEDLISEKVVKSLIPRLTGEEEQQLSKRGTNNAEAYEAYLRGRYHWNQFTPNTLLKAQKSFEKAIEMDSSYALAYVGLADFYIWANIYGLIPSGKSLPLAESSARRALELDDKLGEAYASLGLTQQNRFSWAKAEQLYAKALEFAPNYVHAHEWWAAQLVGHGKFEKGVEEMKIAERLDPLSLRTKALTSWTLYQARYYDEALERGQQIFDLDENYPQAYLQRGNNLLQMGKIEEAIENYQKFNAMIPKSALAKYPLCHALAAGGRYREAEAVLEKVKVLARQEYVKPYFLGMSYAALGQRDEAFANFERAFAEDDPWMLWFGTEPLLDDLRDDPRFDDLLRRMNLPQSNRKKIEPEKSAKTNETNSIAVLPLKMIGGFEPNDTGEEFLGVGLTDALIMRLSQLRSFIVRPTSSVLRFNGTDIDPFEAGRQLEVRYILEGNIRRAANQLRVTLQLLDLNSNSTVWAEQFSGSPSDIFILEDEISEQVSKSIFPQITSDEQKQLHKHGTENTEAYEFYLRGRFHWNQFSLEGFSKAMTFYQRAIEIAPDYALAYAGLADYYNFLGVYTIKPFAETSAAAKGFALKSVELDPALAEGYSALGFATLMHDFDWDSAESHLRRAIELKPNYVLGRVWYCYFLGMQKRFDESFLQIYDALKLDSMTPIVPQTLNWTFYFARQYEESIAATRKLVAKEPFYGLSHVFMCALLSTVGEYDEAIGFGQKAVQLIGEAPYTLLWLASAYAAAGRRQEVEEILEKVREMSETRYVSPYMMGMVYCNLGETEMAFVYLERALAIRDARLVWMNVDPQFDPLRNDPRLNELLRRTGNRW